MHVIPALLALLGATGLIQGPVALARNVRWFSSRGWGPRPSPMFIALAVGALLAVGTFFVSYPLGEAGRICGAPFPVATPKASALPRALHGVLPELPRESGCWPETWGYPFQLLNVASALALAQIALWIWVSKPWRPLPTPSGRWQWRWWDIVLFLGTISAMVPYIYFSPSIPGAWRRLPSWTSIGLGRDLLTVPPALMLVAWWVASSWMLQPRITVVARCLWVLALVLAAVAFVPWCIHAVLWDRPSLHFQVR